MLNYSMSNNNVKFSFSSKLILQHRYPSQKLI